MEGLGNTEVKGDEKGGGEIRRGGSCKGSGSGPANKSNRQYREIYRPPSVRTKDARKDGNGHRSDPIPIGDPAKAVGYRSPHMAHKQYGNRKGNHNQQSHNYSSGMGKHQPQGMVPLNVNAKEFQSNGQHPNNYPMGGLYMASTSFNLYQLQQSKSLGNNLNILIQQHLQNSQMGQNLQHPYGQQNGVQHNNQQFRNGEFLPQQPPNSCFKQPLAHSKSSGSLVEKPRVRFDLDGIDSNGFGGALKYPQLEKGQGGMPNGKIQKSKTGFSLNLYSPDIDENHQGPMNGNGNVRKQEQGENKERGGGLRRSRSFGSGGSGNGPSAYTTAFSDFQISKWPKKVQEIVTSAVTAVERTSARQQIEMVTSVFDAMLKLNSKSTEEALDEKEDSTKGPLDEEEEDLTSAGVHIFLYFIHKEKERTVMESLLNACFANFQKLFGSTTNKSKFEGGWASQCRRFLKFLSTFFSQVKVLRRPTQATQNQPLEDMSFSILALLCNSCLGLLRSPLTTDPDSMGCLFTVLTSHGKEIERSFPLKMKQLLAAVRDNLLGLSPHTNDGLSPVVKRTLMQLIELHAASWALPANAVQYYYSSAPSAKK